MGSLPEDRPPDTGGDAPVDPFDVPAGAVSAAGDASPSSAGAAAAEEGSDDALWKSSYGYLLTQACAAARPQRPDLSDDEFVILANQAFPMLSGHWGSAPAEILAYINAVRPPAAPQSRAPEPRVTSRRGLRLEQALARLREEGRAAPTQAEIAEACEPEIAERTLRGWLHKEPELRELLPWLPRAADDFAGR